MSLKNGRTWVTAEPGIPAAPTGNRLPLLPSGPDGVHRPVLHGPRIRLWLTYDQWCHHDNWRLSLIRCVTSVYHTLRQY